MIPFLVLVLMYRFSLSVKGKSSEQMGAAHSPGPSAAWAGLLGLEGPGWDARAAKGMHSCRRRHLRRQTGGDLGGRNTPDG